MTNAELIKEARAWPDGQNGFHAWSDARNLLAEMATALEASEGTK